MAKSAGPPAPGSGVEEQPIANATITAMMVARERALTRRQGSQGMECRAIIHERRVAGAGASAAT